MSCHNIGGGPSKKRKIAIISGAGIAATGIAYVSLAENPLAVAVIPAVLAFAACPAMCAAMGGAMWLNRRISKRKNQTQVQHAAVNSKQEAAAAAKTEGMESEQIIYPQKRRKNKVNAQDKLQLVINSLA